MAEGGQSIEYIDIIITSCILHRVLFKLSLSTLTQKYKFLIYYLENAFINISKCISLLLYNIERE